MLKKLIIFVCLFGVVSFANAADLEKALKSVVLITMTKTSVLGIPESGLGSGFYVTPHIIVTANHVVDDSDSFTLHKKDMVSFKGKIIAQDKDSDIAFIKTDVAGEPLDLNANDPKVGEDVYALGHPFENLFSVTKGIVSNDLAVKEGMPLTKVLQIDASVNSGNSGGPIINDKGEALGVVSYIESPNRGSIGLNFAISSQMVKRMLTSIEKYGKIKRLILGVMYKDENGHVVVKSFSRDSIGSKYYKQNDIVESVDGEKVTTFSSFLPIIILSDLDHPVKIVVKRGDDLVTLSIPLEEIKN